MLAGIDIGGTKTHLIVERSDGRQRERVVETSQWRKGQESGADAKSLACLLLELNEGPPKVTVVGAHGCDTDADCVLMQSSLSNLLSGAILVLNDSELLLPAAEKSHGIAVISGTGSIAVSRNAEGQMMSAGGWGWFLGDEGSASGLVRDAARTVRLSLDDGQPLDRLGNALLAALGVASPVNLGRALSELASAARIGALVHTIFEAAAFGSSLAEDVIMRGGDALALLVQQLVSRGAAEGDVVTAGGVISRQGELLAAFKTALARRVPHAKLTLLTQPPVTGALLLARSLARGERKERLPRPHRSGRQEVIGDGRTA